MSTARLTPPPIQVDANDFAFKKWFQDIYQYSQGGVLIPAVDSTIQQYGHRNLLINGSFQVNQRGATSYNNGAGTSYTVDRWAIGARTAGTYSATRVTGPTGFKYAMNIARGGADTTTGEIFFVNMSESNNAYMYAGKKIVLSFWLKCSAGFSGTAFVPSAHGETFEARVQSGTGIDEGPLAAMTGSTDVIFGYFNPTTTWTYYQFSGTVPANSTELKTYFGWNPPASVTADNSITITGVQVEIARDQLNPIATAFEFVPFDMELNRCLRYYQKSFDYATAPAQNLNILNGALVYESVLAGAKGFTPYVSFAGQMRRTASSIYTFYNYANTNNKWRNFSSGADSGSPTVSSQGEKGFGLLNPQVAADLASQFFVIHWSVDSELF